MGVPRGRIGSNEPYQTLCMKSAQFPILGKIGAEYHTPGKEITGLNLPANERVITIDDLLISHAFIANIDEAMNHYDVRGPYSQELGRSLAYTYDKHILQLAVMAARDTSPVSGEAGGGKVADATMLTDTTAEKLVAALFATNFSADVSVSIVASATLPPPGSFETGAVSRAASTASCKICLS